MPSTSPAQKRLMAAVAHGWHKPGGGGPSVAVAKDFNRADAAMNKGYQGSTARFAKGGAVIGANSQFLKTPDQFREGKGVEQDYSSKGGRKGKDKSLSPVKPRS